MLFKYLPPVLVAVMVIVGTFVFFMREKSAIIRICADGTRIYLDPDGKYRSDRNEVVPGPEVCSAGRQ